MNHEIHSVQSLFWRNAYVAALGAGHADPAAAADEAFLAFDCRFGIGEEPPVEQQEPITLTLVCEGSQEKSAYPTAALWPTPPTADDLVKQANELPTTTPSVVVRDPSAEVLPDLVPRADDEALG